MSGFKGFTNDKNKDGNVRFEIDTSEVTKLVKKYKKLKKFQNQTLQNFLNYLELRHTLINL